MIKAKSKHTSTFIFLTSSDRRGVGETIRSDATGKDQTLVFSVNDIKFHPVHGTFTTCGT